MAFVTLEYMSIALGRSVTVRAILPSDHLGGIYEPPYRTLYFLPGYSASASQLLSYLPFRRECELKGIAVVMPDGENLFYQDLPDRMTFYATYVGKELVEQTRALLPLSNRREDTFIGGISMGGYGALYLGMKFSGTFSKVAAMSPAADPVDLFQKGAPGFTWEQFTRLFGDKEMFCNSESNAIKAWCEADVATAPKLYLCCGAQDRAVYSAVRLFEEKLTQAGFPHKYREGYGDHEMYYWEQCMDSVFSFLGDIPEKTKDKLIIPG